jgi:erythritol transport system ATP-binding protein
MFFKEKPVSFKNTTEASEIGIGIIHQELSLFPNMTVMQNLFAGREIRKNKVLIDKKLQREITVKALDQLKHPINPDSLVSSLRVGGQQIIEIARNVAKENLEILIMDEPTSSLSEAEVNDLFDVIEDLKSKGIAIVYISHRLEEIMKIGDNITVLRDGKIVANALISDITLDWIVEQMVGGKVIVPNKTESSITDEEVLRVEDISLFRSGRDIFKDVSFNLRKGEILGIYGLLGSGRTEIFEALMGVCPPDSGQIYIKGKLDKAKNVSQQIKNGFALIPEDRQREGLVQTLNIKKNLTLSSLQNYVKAVYISKSSENAAADRMIGDVGVKTSNKELPILSLSGGNQQKVVIGKGLLTNPEILLLDEPARGIDVGAKAEVFAIIEELAKRGLSIIIISSELKEIIAIADRIIVLAGGIKSGELSGDEINEQSLVALSSASAVKSAETNGGHAL